MQAGAQQRSIVRLACDDVQLKYVLTVVARAVRVRLIFHVHGNVVAIQRFHSKLRIKMTMENDTVRIILYSFFILKIKIFLYIKV